MGIFFFNALSYVWAPPTLWVLATALVLLAFLRSQATGLVAAVSALLLIGVISYSPLANERDLYSPYQKLTLRMYPGGRELSVNNLYYQRLLNLDSANVSGDTLLEKWRSHYDLPYHFKPESERVLVVGAGTGNDVAAAVRAGVDRIDAVEIDPAILRFGRLLHPERPYQRSNVNSVVADARVFIRHTPTRYDLIVYGLLDSHTLLSGKAGVRLDSYVYTVEGFREARAKLKEGGLISLTFSLVRESLGRKLYLMLQEAFDGQSPVVYRTGYDNGLAFLIGEDMAASESPALPGLHEVTADFASSDERIDLSTDNWPFFYMPTRTYPVSYLIMIMILLGVSLVFVRQVVPGSGTGASWPCFFLGAGFMLIETKGITELALVYGSTWTVIGVVISGILLMAFMANWIILRWGAPASPVTYGLLLLSIVVGLSFTSARLSGMPSWLSGAVLTAALTLPMFFSGFAFSSELKRSSSVAVALSSNLLGAMLGGFLEYNSMYFGLRSLYFLAIVMYTLAFLTSVRPRTAGSDYRQSELQRIASEI